MIPIQENTDLEALGLRGQPSGPSNDELGQEQFLKLMTTQLTNQDPLKPMDNGDFLGQLAQFGTVSGIQELQQSFATLAGSLQSSQTLQAANMLGHEVVVPGNLGSLTEGETLTGVVEVPQSVPEVVINIADPGGQLVRRLELGPQAAGPLRFNWDGVMDNGEYAGPGLYEVSAEAVIGGENQALESLMSAEVESVSIGRNGEGLTVHLSGIGPVPFSDIREIL